LELPVLLNLETEEPLAKFLGDFMKRQGTTSVVPQTQQNKCRALAPAPFVFNCLQFGSS
jgi:hypothetical protein